MDHTNNSTAMKFIVLDVQGFFTKTFQAKELAIYDGKNMKHYVFKPERPLHELEDKYKKCISYVYNKHLGIHYNTGFEDYENVYSILYEELKNVDRVYVRGQLKKEFIWDCLSTYNLCGDMMPHIVNLEYDTNCPKFEMGPPKNCDYHDRNICKCSINFASMLYKYVVKSLPE